MRPHSSQSVSNTVFTYSTTAQHRSFPVASSKKKGGMCMMQGENTIRGLSAICTIPEEGSDMFLSTWRIECTSEVDLSMEREP